MTDCQCLYWVLQVSPSFFYNPNIVVSIDVRYQAYLLSVTYGRQHPILIPVYWMAVSAVSFFLYYILDGSISSIPVYLPYLGWYYRQYHIQLLYTYISPFPIFSNSLLIDTFFTTSFHNEFSFSKLVYSPQWGLISIINFWVLISD